MAGVFAEFNRDSYNDRRAVGVYLVGLLVVNADRPFILAKDAGYPVPKIRARPGNGIPDQEDAPAPSPEYCRNKSQ